jgi:hypothetical protein
MEGTQTEARKSATGRKGKDKQEAVTKPEVVASRIGELVNLYNKAGEASDALNDGIKTAAKDSGYNAANVRKFVIARAGEDFAEKKRDAEQQLELFDEVGA